MERVGFSKRELLRGAALLPLTLAGSRAAAQEGSLFGLPVPREILDAIPRKPLSYVRLADEIVRLEGEADRKQIPDSPLSRNKGIPIAGFDDAIYQLVLPRLVALIDRAETVDVGLADKAGELLAEIHQTQHELPEFFRLQPASFEAALHGREDVKCSDAVVIPVPDIQLQPAPDPVEEPDKPLSKARNYEALKDELIRMFRKLTVRPERAEAAEWHLAMIRKSRKRYESVGEQTGVPWYFIAVIHGLESSFNFRAHLHNGDFPLTARTRQVPAGRPTKWLPPSDWESSAKDALRVLGFTGQTDWSLERTLYRLEAFNGFGYRSYGVPTPYLWSFSQLYDRGKFVSDGKFSYSARSQQCGTAVMLKLLENGGDIALSPPLEQPKETP